MYQEDPKRYRYPNNQASKPKELSNKEVSIYLLMGCLFIAFVTLGGFIGYIFGNDGGFRENNRVVTGIGKLDIKGYICVADRRFMVIDNPTHKREHLVYLEERCKGNEHTGKMELK